MARKFWESFSKRVASLHTPSHFAEKALDDIMHPQALRYQRALVYDALGQKSRARAAFETLYAENPDYEDVARLGV